MSAALCATTICRVFNATFARRHAIVMVGGASEPRYLPETAPHRSVLCFREDFAASALHEAAHWCIAGAQRRRLRDFGYWYQPPPRKRAQQLAFFQVEAKVQALESFFASAAGVPFQPSADDPEVCVFELSNRVAAARVVWQAGGLGARSRLFIEALTQQRRAGEG